MIVFVGWDSFKFFVDLCEMDEKQFVGNFLCNLKTILILQFGVCCCRQYSFRLLTGLFVMVFRIVVGTSNRWDLKFIKGVKNMFHQYTFTLVAFELVLFVFQLIPNFDWMILYCGNTYLDSFLWNPPNLAKNV